MCSSDLEQDGGPPGRGHPCPLRPRRERSGGRARAVAGSLGAGLGLCWRRQAAGPAARQPGGRPSLHLKLRLSPCWPGLGRKEPFLFVCLFSVTKL